MHNAELINQSLINHLIDKVRVELMDIFSAGKFELVLPN